MTVQDELVQHPMRVALHNEVHARPPEALQAPLVLSHIVMLADAEQRAASRAHLVALLRDHHLPQPNEQSTHVRMDVGPFRIRWEMHTEFVTWTFQRVIEMGDAPERDPGTALDAVPRQWLAALPGQCLTSLHLWVLPTSRFSNAAWVQQLLNEQTLVGSGVANGQGEVHTDFAIHADGFSRMILFTASIPARQLGRIVQHLIEIETYRMAGLLGLPSAREAVATLAQAERELAELAEAIRRAGRHDEAELLDRLTRLAAQVESQYASTHSRFSASAAYFELVDRRIGDIAESRLGTVQTLGEFVERRLTPARSTCQWAARRQEGLSQRVSRMSNLLRTRVEIDQQQSSQALLATMNQRQGLQLRLQSTVEGLSVAAITYYVVGLVSYAAKGLQPWGWPLAADLTAALAIPAVGAAVWWGLRRMHRSILGH